MRSYPLPHNRCKANESAGIYTENNILNLKIIYEVWQLIT